MSSQSHNHQACADTHAELGHPSGRDCTLIRMKALIPNEYLHLTILVMRPAYVRSVRGRSHSNCVEKGNLLQELSAVPSWWGNPRPIITHDFIALTALLPSQHQHLRLTGTAHSCQKTLFKAFGDDAYTLRPVPVYKTPAIRQQPSFPAALSLWQIQA